MWLCLKSFLYYTSAYSDRRKILNMKISKSNKHRVLLCQSVLGYLEVYILKNTYCIYEKIKWIYIDLNAF